MNLLKRLEVNGFKSFAQRTVFDFSTGITAIVGPNGSGKSNIIDAIRWLLGEREARQLRGGKGEDLIFAGTPKRPRLGQARASLYFDNSSGFFNLDFPEITITREVNRDSSNRYLLNRSEVRLRDLVEFLSQARLGARGPMIVTQGESDVFVKADPRGRREMVEEILGLREYQLKKTEAERRWRETQINLDKARALSEEILPHLRSLKRQAHRWQKREELGAELDRLEKQFFGAAYRELEEKARTVEEAIKKEEMVAAALEEERRKAEEELKRVEATQPKERKELKEIQEKIRVLLSRRGELEREIGRLEARGEGETVHADGNLPLSRKAETLLDLLRDIKVQLEVVLDEPAEAERIISGLLERIEEVLRLIGEKETVIGVSPRNPAVATVKTEKNAALEKLKKELEALEKEVAVLREKEKKVESGQERFYHTFRRAVTKLETAKDKLEQWKSGYQKLLFEKERLNLYREEWEKQVQQAGRRPEEFYRQPVEEIGEIQNRNEMEKRIFRLRGELAAIGEIDPALIKEAEATAERYQFLQKETDDLEKARRDLKKLIGELNTKIKTEFSRALGRINSEFDKFFGLMFGGGRARLKLAAVSRSQLGGGQAGEKVEEAELPAAKENGLPAAEAVADADEVEEGLEIEIRVPRKRITSLDMLSGGERSLVGIAALFAMISVSPPPFLVLDEVDAALDERNSRRFAELLKEFSKKTQFIVVTHNRATMEVADILYGVTMNDDGTSKVVSLKLS